MGISRLLDHWRNAPLFDALVETLNVEVSPRVLLAVLAASTALGLIMLALEMRMVVIASSVVLPWLPIFARKLRTDWHVYGWLAFFELLVLLQIVHFAEHISQMIELHWLSWPAVLARGIVGELDIEPVHFWWNLAILFSATLLLLVPYRKNAWLWGSWAFSVWHQIEHIYIYFGWFLAKGISGHPGILGAGGIIDEADVAIPVLTTLGRADLHFWYNFLEIGLFVLAFLVQARKLILPNRRVAFTAQFNWQRAPALVGAGQVALVILVGLIHYSPVNLNVPQNYATIQSAIDAAPDWAIIRIAPGVYREALHIHKPLTLTGSGRATTVRVENDTVPAITVHQTHDVTIANLTVEGGLYGILVDYSRAVQIKNDLVTGAWFVGIRVSVGAASIESSVITETRSPFGMGIEVANTAFSAPTLIRNNTVSGHPHEGIVMHNSNAMIERNVVAGNGLRGISVTEMSMATIKSNWVTGNADAGIYVVDNSMAEIFSNHIRDVKPGPNGHADGIRAYFYAEVVLDRNTIEVDAEHAIVTGYNSTIETNRVP